MQVWHTHQFHPQNYSNDCVRVAGKVIDHIEDSESDSDSDTDSGGGSGAIFDTSDRITHLGQQVAHVWQEVPVPVIAAAPPADAVLRNRERWRGGRFPIW